MNRYIKESANINPGPGTDIFLHFYKELLTYNYLQENYWNIENVDDAIITREELKEAPNNEKWKMSAEGNLNSELSVCAGDSVHERQLFLITCL
jgi:hypothetical protein